MPIKPSLLLLAICFLPAKAVNMYTMPVASSCMHGSVHQCTVITGALLSCRSSLTQQPTCLEDHAMVLQGPLVACNVRIKNLRRIEHSVRTALGKWALQNGQQLPPLPDQRSMA